jgi:cell division transport system ATP-binding protein
LFEELNKLGTTIVVATHNEAMVEQLGHPVMRLDNGSLKVTQGARAARLLGGQA